MAVSAELFKAWVESKGGDEGTTLGSLYLGEDVSMLNADQVVEVVNGPWHDFCGGQSESADEMSKADLAERFGDWSYVSGGMAGAVIAMDGESLRVDRFCGGWTLNGAKTAALLEAHFEAAHEDKRP